MAYTHTHKRSEHPPHPGAPGGVHGIGRLLWEASRLDVTLVVKPNGRVQATGPRGALRRIQPTLRRYGRHHGQAIAHALSPIPSEVDRREVDCNFEPADIVDGLFCIARAIHRLAEAHERAIHRLAEAHERAIHRLAEAHERAHPSITAPLN